jgi:hypothetical protein
VLIVELYGFLTTVPEINRPLSRLGHLRELGFNLSTADDPDDPAGSTTTRPWPARSPWPSS